jgi:hypothetical protein
MSSTSCSACVLQKALFGHSWPNVMDGRLSNFRGAAAPETKEAANCGGLIASKYPIRFGDHSFCRSNGLFGDQDKFVHFALHLECPRQHLPVEVRIAII